MVSPLPPVFTSYSATRADVILNRLFAGLPSGFYIDVGAGHPIYENDTKALYDRGWRGINIEPNPASFRDLAEQRPLDQNMNVAVSDVPGRVTFHQVVGTGLSTCDAEAAKRAAAMGFDVVAYDMEATTLRRILEAMPIPPIDLLKVGVERFALQVLSSNDWTHFRPKVILVAFGFPGTPVRREDGVAPYLAARGYRQVCFDGLNDYYVHQDFQTVPEMFDRPPNVSDRFQPYVRLLAEERDCAVALVSSVQEQARLAMRRAEALSVDVENARAELIFMRERGTALAAQLEALEQEHERLKAAETERAASVVRLASQLEQVYASTSWRITGPLRELARPGRNLRRMFRRLRR